MSRRGLLRTTWVASGVAVLAHGRRHRAVAAAGVGARRPLRERAAGSADQPLGGLPRRRRGRHQPVVPAHGGVRRPPGAAEPRPTCGPCRRRPHRSRSPASRAGARAADLDRRAACATCSTWSTRPPASEVLVESLQAARRRAGQHAGRQLLRPPAHPAGPRARRRAALARPRLPVPPHRAGPARRPADQVGRPAGGDVVMRAIRAAWPGRGRARSGVRRVVAARPRLGQHPLDPGLARRRCRAARRCLRGPGAGSSRSLAVRLVPRDHLAPVVVALVILGTGHPGRHPGARAGSAPAPTTRRCSTGTYWLGWSVMVTLVVVGVLVGAVATRRRTAAEGVTMTRVLVVDDDVTVREVVVTYLRAGRARRATRPPTARPR